jgi:hypothetical protein
LWLEHGGQREMKNLDQFELQTRILENHNQLLDDATKPWRELADMMQRTLTKEEDIERTADCAQRYLYDLCHMNAFKEVREILRHTHEYMAETIEVLEERDEPSHPAQFHRSSA